MSPRPLYKTSDLVKHFYTSIQKYKISNHLHFFFQDLLFQTTFIHTLMYQLYLMCSVIRSEYGIDRNNTVDNEHSASQTLISKAVPESLLNQWSGWWWNWELSLIYFFWTICLLFKCSIRVLFYLLYFVFLNPVKWETYTS